MIVYINSEYLRHILFLAVEKIWAIIQRKITKRRGENAKTI